MRQSSIHIEPGKRHYFLHNDRTQKTNNSIFNNKNYYSKSAAEALKEYDQLIKERTKKYEERTGQKLQSKTVKHLSAVVNLEAHHTKKDLEKVVDYLEKTLDTKVVQYVIHHDEGHVDEDTGEEKINYHAHIEFLGLDSEGKSVRRKLTKQYLQDLQTKTAELLNMERGQRNSRRKRLDTYEYKEHKKQEQKTKRITQKELKKTIQELRKELQKLGGIREDYRLLEEEHRKLRNLIKTKDENLQNVEQLKKELEEKLKKQIEEREQTRIETNKQIQQQVNKVIDKGNKSIILNNTVSFDINELKKILTSVLKGFTGIKIVEKQLKEYQTLTKQQKQKIEVLTERLQQDGDVDSLKYEIKQLKRTINENLEDYNKIKNEYEKEIQQLKKQLPKKPSKDNNKDKDNDYKPTYNPTGPGGLGR